MLRSLALIVVCWLAAALPAFAAKEDAVCVQSFLINANFLDGTADGALGPKSLKAAEAFLERTGLSGSLPALSNETAPQWCQFLNSGQAQDQIELASLTLYDIAIEGDLPAIDDGTGPLPFDFSPYKLTAKYDGVACSYAMTAMFADGNSHVFVTGDLQFADGGRVSFTNTAWTTGGMSSPETFNRANIAITDDTKLVGTMPVFHLFAQEGYPVPSAEIVTLKPEGSQLSDQLPQGNVGFAIGSDKGEMKLRCKSPDGPVKIAFDFSPYKLSTSYEGYQCNAQIVSRFEDSGVEDPSGTVVFKIDGKGKINVDFGQWMTRGPISSFKEANLALTKDRRLVGIMDVYAEFPDPDPHPPVTISLDGSEGQLDEALKGTAKMKINQNTLALFNINICRPPA